MKKILLLSGILLFALVGCGDAESLYNNCIKNKTSLEVIVRFSPDSIIVCPPKQETIIGTSVSTFTKELTCETPRIFKEGLADIVVDKGNKVLLKDITDDNNWDCRGDKVWSLITVGGYYSKITSTFTIDNEDIENIFLRVKPKA